MPEKDETQNSKLRLENLTKALTEAFKVEDDSDDLESILNDLSSVEYCREIELDQANQRVQRLLSKHR